MHIKSNIMNSFISIIKYDYLQRARSYSFLITLCVSLAIGYTFVPEPNANYSTLRIAGYVGYYNSAWFGYVTAIMTSIFLSLIGFYLINSGIKKDLDTRVGQIIAATSIKNRVYLLAKVLSNFLILLTIVFLVFCMSLFLFFIYNDGYNLELLHFIKPYLVITIPAMFIVSVIAVVFEVFLGRYSALQNVGFFFLFSALLIPAATTELEFTTDAFGTKIVIDQLERRVQNITGVDDSITMNIGYVIGNAAKAKKFEFNGVDFPISFLISRLAWMTFGILIIIIMAPYFHRFNTREKALKKQRLAQISKISISKDIQLNQLPKVIFNSSISPLIKMELLLLFRNGKRWLWLINILGVVLLSVLPIDIAHAIVLPILWFLQVARLSKITTKELTNNTHYFAFASNKPLQRLLLAQVIAAVLIMLVLALPLIVRLVLYANFYASGAVILGGIFVVLLAFTLGILTKGKKLFEVLFFMITYANMNRIPFLDYFGSQSHSGPYIAVLVLLVGCLACISFLARRFQLKHL